MPRSRYFYRLTTNVLIIIITFNKDVCTEAPKCDRFLNLGGGGEEDILAGRVNVLATRIKINLKTVANKRKKGMVKHVLFVCVRREKKKRKTKWHMRMINGSEMNRKAC